THDRWDRGQADTPYCCTIHPLIPLHILVLLPFLFFHSFFDPWIHPNLLLDPAQGGGRGEKGDLRRSAVVGGGRSSSLTTRSCCSLPPSIGWPWSWAPLNLNGGSPLESPQVEAGRGLPICYCGSFHLCNVLQLCIIPTFCTRLIRHRLESLIFLKKW
uniref:Uncharacterized protein n=1 Tax=Aegilops tauschii subsp. strangulata TaxID=200361 RepID=A0A452Y5X0_AEGTS